MNFSILHLNIERDGHIRAVLKLLQDKKPDIICFAEAMHKNVESIACDLNYHFTFAPRVIFKDHINNDEEGSAILSKYPISDIQKHIYNDKPLDKTPEHTVEENLVEKKGKRPEDRFLLNYTLLTVSIKLNEKENIIVATTHFPVTDHTEPGYKDHEILSLKNVDDMEHSEIYLERLIKLIRSTNSPLVFTADLNNARGEYFYDSIAHELVDRVPISLESSIDPNLHRVKNLKLVVDTIMTSPDFSVKSFQVVEGVSDHKAFLASLEI